MTTQQKAILLARLDSDIDYYKDQIRYCNEQIGKLYKQNLTQNNTKLNFDIKTESTQRAKAEIIKTENLSLCLVANICPKCSEELFVTVDGNRDRKYRCTSVSCNFIWPQEEDSNIKSTTAYIVCLGKSPKYVILNDRDKAVKKLCKLSMQDNCNDIVCWNIYETEVE